MTKYSYTPAVGDIVVVFYTVGYPLQHASHLATELGGDGCRGRVLKVGRKWAHVSSRGTPIMCAIAGEGHGNFALPLELARKRHAENFPADDWRRSKPAGDEYHIDNILSRL